MNSIITPEIPDNVEDDELDLSAIYGSNPDIQPVPTLNRTVSFKEPIVDSVDADTKVSTKRRFIMRSTIIDKFNTRRIRVLLTPSVCDVCAFDVAEKNFGGWNQVPVDQRETVQKALAEHKKVAHTMADHLIVDEDQLPTKWLGGGKL